MKDQSKTKQVLIQEMDSLRERIAALERAESERKRTEGALRESEERYRILAESSPSMIFLLDVQGNVLVVNEKSATQFGMKPDAMIGRNVRDLFPERIAEQHMQAIKKVIRDGEMIHSELCEPFPVGERWIDARIVPVRNKNGTITAVLGISHDITDRVRADEALKESEEKHRNLFQNANEAIFVAQDGKLVFLNPMSVNLIGYSGEEVMSRSFIEFIHPDDRDMVIDRHMRRMKGEEIPHLYSFRIIHRDGNVKWVELNAVLISWEGKTATLNFMSDITARKQTEEAIRQMAYHDTLTGLPNRKLFFDRLDIALAQAQRNQRGVAIAMLDLDNFKDVNDHLGHDRGDLALKECCGKIIGYNEEGRYGGPFRR
jgi:PAS domain S-box-containing protein